MKIVIIPALCILLTACLTGCIRDTNPDDVRDNQPWNEGSHGGGGFMGPGGSF